jgi:hypothetical protein
VLPAPVRVLQLLPQVGGVVDGLRVVLVDERDGVHLVGLIGMCHIDREGLIGIT